MKRNEDCQLSSSCVPDWFAPSRHSRFNGTPLRICNMSSPSLKFCVAGRRNVRCPEDKGTGHFRLPAAVIGVALRTVVGEVLPRIFSSLLAWQPWPTIFFFGDRSWNGHMAESASYLRFQAEGSFRALIPRRSTKARTRASRRSKRRSQRNTFRFFMTALSHVLGLRLLPIIPRKWTSQEQLRLRAGSRIWASTRWQRHKPSLALPGPWQRAE